MQEATPLWVPSQTRVEQSLIHAFMTMAAQRMGVVCPDYQSLYRWSISDSRQFWSLLWEFCEVIGDRGERVLADGDDMLRARWFPEARLNFAENLLRPGPDETAIFSRVENGPLRRLSFAELYRQVAAVAAWLDQAGVGRGDRVAGYLANIPETLVAMLATASLGAVWTSTSPDFGAGSVIERFGQTTPKILFAGAVSTYNGKRHDHRAKIEAVTAAIGSIERTVIIDDHGSGAVTGGPRDGWQDVVATDHDGTIDFVRCGFNDPLYILYSSGTTGKPKCIVHGIGGTLLQHLKEHQLHCDIRPGDRVFYFTTCGWMMWNWLASVLASRAAAVLYDGSPLYPDAGVLWDYAEQSRLSLFGTSAKYLDLLKKQQFEPGRTFPLSSLRTICSTGSVLAPESFDYVYRSIKRDVCLASISGGTDIVSCFVLGCPILPVYRGECQCRGLGMAVEVFDEAGRPLLDEQGELVCTRPFPSQPLGFWGDTDGSSYRRAYFATYDGIWHHGDFITLTSRGTVIIHGRSDTTLNPGGVRIGTAEIYRCVDALDEVLESIAVGQQWQGDTRIVLFVVLRQSLLLTEELAGRIRRAVREGCSPRHVPAKIIQVETIPRTKSGKIVETAVREVIHRRPVRNLGALANPEALELFRDRPELLD